MPRNRSVVKPLTKSLTPKQPEASQQESDGLALLMNLVKHGEMDPWNLDIAKLADEYLKAVAEQKDADLKITGKTLLYLAILLRMKSDALAGLDIFKQPEDEFDDEFDDDSFELEMGNLGQKILPYQTLDQLIERRTSTKEKRIRRVSLKDLILELKRYENLEAKQDIKRKVDQQHKRRVQDYTDLNTDDIEELAHEEFIEDTVLRLKSVLGRLLTNTADALGGVTLSDLMETGGLDKVSAFLALLFLTASGDVDLHQEQFYSEVYVSSVNLSEQPVEQAG